MLSKPYSSAIVTGSIAYDEIMDFPGKFADYFHLERLHQINISFVVNRLERQLGGTASNIAYNATLLTKKTVTILGAIGKDGNQILRFFKKLKINVDGIIKDKHLYSSCGTVFTDENDNQIWSYYYGAGQKAKTIKLSKRANENLLLVISANHRDSFLNFQNQAIGQKIDYFYDPGMMITAISIDQLIKGIKNCRWLIGNDYEIANILRITKLNPKALINNGVTIITTLGEKGVRYESRNRKMEVGGWKAKKVVDPTGAGDAWRGGFVAGLLENKPLIDCLKLGNVIASFAIEKYGTVNHRPSKKEIEKRLRVI